VERDDLGEVRLSREPPHRAGEPRATDGDTEHPDRRRDDADDERGDEEDSRGEHRLSFADPARERTRRKVPEQLTDSRESDDEARDPHRGAQVQCRQGDDRGHRALADAVEQRRKVHP
jgi:hypothetical protein